MPPRKTNQIRPAPNAFNFDVLQGRWFSSYGVLVTVDAFTVYLNGVKQPAKISVTKDKRWRWNRWELAGASATQLTWINLDHPRNDPVIWSCILFPSGQKSQKDRLTLTRRKISDLKACRERCRLYQEEDYLEDSDEELVERMKRVMAESRGDSDAARVMAESRGDSGAARVMAESRGDSGAASAEERLNQNGTNNIGSAVESDCQVSTGAGAAAVSSSSSTTLKRSGASSSLNNGDTRRRRLDPNNWDLNGGGDSANSDSESLYWPNKRSNLRSRTSGRPIGEQSIHLRSNLVRREYFEVPSLSKTIKSESDAKLSGSNEKLNSSPVQNLTVKLSTINSCFKPYYSGIFHIFHCNTTPESKFPESVMKTYSSSLTPLAGGGVNPITTTLSSPISGHRMPTTLASVCTPVLSQNPALNANNPRNLLHNGVTVTSTSNGSSKLNNNLSESSPSAGHGPVTLPNLQYREKALGSASIRGILDPVKDYDPPLSPNVLRQLARQSECRLFKLADSLLTATFETEGIIEDEHELVILHYEHSDHVFGVAVLEVHDMKKNILFFTIRPQYRDYKYSTKFIQLMLGSDNRESTGMKPFLEFDPKKENSDLKGSTLDEVTNSSTPVRYFTTVHVPHAGPTDTTTTAEAAASDSKRNLEQFWRKQGFTKENPPDAPDTPFKNCITLEFDYARLKTGGTSSEEPSVRGGSSRARGSARESGAKK